VTAPEDQAKHAGGEIQKENEESPYHSVQFDLGFRLHSLACTARSPAETNKLRVQTRGTLLST